MDWKQLLAYITGSVDQELLLRHECLIMENRILRQQIPGRIRLGDEERKTMAEIGKKLGKQALARWAASQSERASCMSTQIAISMLETPIGALWIACSAQGVGKLVLPSEGAKEALDRWLTLHYPHAEIQAASPVLEQAKAELGEYFAGTRQTFAVSLEWRGPAFQRRVWQALSMIPYGHTLSYGALARTLGLPKAARAVGAACGANPVPIIAPCHRVLGSDGSLHGFGGGLPMKAWLLQHEGVLLDLAPAHG